MRNVRANKRRSSPNPDPVPDPVPKTDITTSHNHVELVDVRAEETDEDFIASEVGRLGVKSFPRVRKAFARVGVVGSDAELVDLAREVLDLSTDHVRSPEAYVETVCRDSPETVTGLWGRVRLPEVVA